MCMRELAWVVAHFIAGTSSAAGEGHRRVAVGDSHGDKYRGDSRRRVLLCIFIFFAGIVSPAHAEVDFAASYARLAAIVKDHRHQPPASENSLEVWLNWIGIKANDRDEVQALLDKANQLYIQNPGNEEYNQWTQKLHDLWQKAQDSGRSTVEDASLKFIRLKDNEENWENALERVKVKGRRIFSKAEQSGFSTEYPRGRSKCLINFALGDIESSEKGGGGSSRERGHGGSLYRNHFLAFGYQDEDGNMRLPDRDFNVMCEGRSEFTRLSEGEPEPDKTIAWALKFVGMIRDEAEWWAFEREKQDATDLMNQYYEDALCKIPPHKDKEGHKYFLDLAKEKELDDSIEYNEGFYATLYGKVEVLRDGVREPAAGAKVTVEDLDETWTVTADAQGNYEIKDAILHKDCSPFDIRAVHDGDWVEEKYDGILEEPDKRARHRVDLLIQPKPRYKWYGHITFTNWERFNCTLKYDTDVISGYQREEKDILQRGNVHINIRDVDVDMAGPGTFHLGPGDMIASGSVTGKYKSRYERELHLKIENENEYISRNDDGLKGFPITDQNLRIQIVNENLTDGDKFEGMAKDIMAGGYDPEAIEAMTKKLEQMMGAGQRSIPVQVQIQFIGDWQGMLKGKKYKQYPDRRKGGEGRTIIEREYYNTKIPLVTSPSFELKGTYTRGKKGNDQLQASYQESRTLPDTVNNRTPVFVSIYRKTHNLPPLELKCPGRNVTNNASFSLSRKRVK